MHRTVISFAKSALRDLEEIQLWYAEQGVPEFGTKLVEAIFERVAVLADHPDTGRVVPEFDQVILRELIYPPFRVVCRHDSERVRVVRVWQNERLLKIPAVDSDRR